MVRCEMVARGLTSLLCLCFSSIVWGGQATTEIKSVDISTDRFMNEVTLNGKMLTVNLRDVPLALALTEIEKKANISFDIDSGLLRHKLSCKFSRVSVEEGIKRILYHYSLFIIYGGDGELSKVYVLRKGNQTREPEKSELGARSPVEKKIIAPEIDFRGGRDSLPPGSDKRPATALEFKPRQRLSPPSKDEFTRAEFVLEKNVPPPGAEGEACMPMKFEGKKQAFPPKRD